MAEVCEFCGHEILRWDEETAKCSWCGQRPRKPYEAPTLRMLSGSEVEGVKAKILSGEIHLPDGRTMRVPRFTVVPVGTAEDVGGYEQSKRLLEGTWASAEWKGGDA